MIRRAWRMTERSKAAGVTAADVMTKPAVTIGEDAPVAEAAQRMQSRRVKRLPVVDDYGRLRGIVSRSDVLSVFERPDDAIWDDVVKYVIVGEFGLDPELFVVTARSGVVTVTGSVDRRAGRAQSAGGDPAPGGRRRPARPAQLPGRGLAARQPLVDDGRLDEGQGRALGPCVVL
jgi:hypothetical protein